MASKLPGVYKMESTDKFEEYMKALGVGIALRKIGNMSKPTVTISLDGNKFYGKSESALKTIEVKCTIGEEFDEETTDGRKCKSVMKWEGDKLVHYQKWDGNATTMTRYVDEDDRLVVLFAYKDVVCTRKYKRST